MSDPPLIVFAVSCVVIGGYYAAICSTVPAKRTLSYKGRLALYTSSSTVGTVNDIIMAVFSILSCILFVWETYSPDAGTPIWMFSTEVVFSTGFAMQYLLGFYTAPSIPAFVFSLQGIVDAVTTIPVFMTLLTAEYSLASGVGFLRFSRVMKFTRILRLLRLFRSAKAISSATENAIRHQMILLVTTIVSILVITTGFVQFLGNEVERGQWGDALDVHFHDALYFTVVTFTTVGYGDIAPGGTIGRIVMLTLVAVTFVLVPFETSKLVRLTRMRSAYGGRLSLTDGHAHIIVCCDVACAGVNDFLKEFFHEDHGAQATRVCLLAPGEPTVAIKSLLLRHKRVTFLKGDAMAGDDLVRARADKAKACFVLTNRFTPDTDEMDSITVLRALNVKSFNPTLDTFVQIIEPENIVHVVSAGVSEENVLCVNSVKLGLLGQSCVFPGFSTVITNLVVSVGISLGYVMLPWQQEYSHGLQQEIYNIALPKWYHGRAFGEVSLIMYREFGAAMFAIGFRDQHNQFRTKLNPGFDFILQPGQIAFVITEDHAAIERIVSYHGAATQVSERDRKRQAKATAKASKRRRRLLSVPWTASKRRQRQEALRAHRQRGHGILEDVFTPSTTALPTIPHEARGSDASDSDISERKAPGPSQTANQPSSRLVVHHPQALPGPGSVVVPSRTCDSPPSVPRPTATQSLLNSPMSIPDAARTAEAKASPQPQPSRATPTRVVMGGGAEGAPSHDGGKADAAPSGSGSGSNPGLPGRIQSLPLLDVEGDEEELHEQQQHVQDPGGGPSVASRTPVFSSVVGRAQLQMARATLVQSVTDIIDSMHGTVQQEFLEDVCAVLNTMVLPPDQQKWQQVVVQKAEQTTPTRRRSFLNHAIVRQPSFKSRSMSDVSASSVDSGTGSPASGGVRDHIVVVCTTADDLQYLVAPLRSTYLSRLPPVVILCPEEPDERMWAELSSFEDLLYVQGVPHIRDLRRAGIHTAECAVILARNTEPVSSGHFSSQDAEVVLTVLDIQAVVKRSIRTLAELNCSRYMKHLGAPVERRKRQLDRARGFKRQGTESDLTRMDVASDDSYIFESSYTSGKVLPANFLESLLCQAYFNPYIVSLVTAMISGCPTGQTRQDRLRRDSFNVSSALQYSPGAPEQSHKCAVTSHAMQIAIPADFHGSTYGELYEHLMYEYNMVPIALYRYGQDLGNDLPFVFTNPAASVIVSSHDLVFVFAPCQLGMKPNEFGSDGFGSVGSRTSRSPRKSTGRKSTGRKSTGRKSTGRRTGDRPPVLGEMPQP